MKTVAFLGDSVTYGYGLDDKSFRYTNLIEKDTKITCLNYGLSGTSIAKSLFKSKVEDFDKDFNIRIKEIEKVDILFIFGGSNDYGHSINPIGKESDKTLDTFYGALNSLVDYAEDNFPKVVLITPIHRFDEVKNIKTPSKGEGSDRLKTYVDIIKKVGASRNIDVIDLFYDSKIVNTKESLALYTIDGIHPSIYGHREIANRIIAYINELDK